MPGRLFAGLAGAKDLAFVAIGGAVQLARKGHRVGEALVALKKCARNRNRPLDTYGYGS